MKVAPWMPDKFEFQQNYPGGQQAYEQSMHNTVQNWQNQQGGMGGPRQQNLGIMGLGGFQGGQNLLGGPRGGTWTGNPMAPPPSNPIQSSQHGFNQFGEQLTGFGEQLGGYEEQMGGFGEQLGGYKEQMGGFGEQLGGYKDLLSGFGEKFGSFGEKLGGFKDEFTNINDKLQGLEQGISSLTDKFGTQQQQQQPQQNYMNPFGSFNPYTPFFGGLGAFMRRY